MSVFLLNLEIAYEISDFLSARDYVRHCSAGHALRILHTASRHNMWFRSFRGIPDLHILPATLVLDSPCNNINPDCTALQPAHPSASDPGHLVTDQPVMRPTFFNSSVVEMED